MRLERLHAHVLLIKLIAFVDCAGLTRSWCSLSDQVEPTSKQHVPCKGVDKATADKVTCMQHESTDLGDKVFDDVGRAVIGYVLAVDSDNVGEGVVVVL